MKLSKTGRQFDEAALLTRRGGRRARLKINVGEIQLGERKEENLKLRRFMCAHTHARTRMFRRWPVWEPSFSLKHICSKLNKLSTIKRYNHLRTRREPMGNVSARVCMCVGGHNETENSSWRERVALLAVVELFSQCVCVLYSLGSKLFSNLVLV